MHFDLQWFVWYSPKQPFSGDEHYLFDVKVFKIGVFDVKVFKINAFDVKVFKIGGAKTDLTQGRVACPHYAQRRRWWNLSGD